MSGQSIQEIQSQGWAPYEPSNSSPMNFAWPLEQIPFEEGGADARALDLFGLMPAFWRPGAADGSEQGIRTGGSRDVDNIAPSREMYVRYNMTAGSARLALNTRWKSPTGSMQETLPGRLPPAIPVGTGDIMFNDSDARQSMIYNSTGFWPDKDTC